jgi:hypothetical protein
MKLSLMKFWPVLMISGLVWAAPFSRNSPPHSQETEVPIVKHLHLGHCASFWSEEVVINDQGTFKKLIEENKSGQCEDQKDVKIDFAKYTILGVNVFADCHTEISLKIIKNDKARVYEFITHEKYGGCRGMDVFSEFVLVEKLPENYSVKFTHIRNDRPR